jgi:hypothetical protein
VAGHAELAQPVRHVDTGGLLADDWFASHRGDKMTLVIRQVRRPLTSCSRLRIT